MVTASAIGNADAPRTNIVVETQKRRYPGYDQRDPASVSFAILLFIPVNTLPNLLHIELLTLVALPYGFLELGQLDRTRQLQQQ
jgi:hypothetical protein